jgi:hypothetical protein
LNLQLVVLLKTKADIAQLVEHLICNQVATPSQKNFTARFETA